MDIKIGDQLRLSHPSASEKNYFVGFVTKESKIKEAPWVRFQIDIYNEKGYWGKDYIGDSIPTGSANCWGMEVVKKIKWIKR